MGKVKLSTRKAFVGRRKMKSRQRGRAVVIEESVVTATTSVPKPHSTSETKLNAFGINMEEMLRQSEAPVSYFEDCYLFVQKSVILDFFSVLLCPMCKQPGLTFTTSSGKWGFATKARLVCEVCDELVKEDFLCERVGGSKSQTDPFDINLRATLAFRGIGCGHSAMKEWASTMNLPHLVSYDSYRTAHQKIADASKQTFQEIVSKSRESIVTAYKEIDEHPDEYGILNIAVSFDGSWQKRGFTSHNGIGAVIDLLTGLPIDFEVLSNFCIKCKAVEGEQEDLEWKTRHEPNCPKNFEGTAGAMEVACAEKLWSRSIEKHNFRYTTILSDGDSKAFDAVTSLNPYGTDIQIQKEDCVNHVSKRMGTALRNLVAMSKAQKVQLSGKGKLTQMKIAKIQNYYGKAIKDNSSDIQLMKKCIMAILLHLSSTNKMPKHMHCPPGNHSWCFWQRAIANSTVPDSHEDHETLPPDIGKKLVPIFLRLSDEALLKRCARQKTQNSNESFHNAVWKLCPKTIYVGRKTVDTAVALAACQFSMGATFKTLLCKTMGLVPGENLKRKAAARTALRLEKAERASSVLAKRRRKELKFKTKLKANKQKSLEGDTYAAGAFDF